MRWAEINIRRRDISVAAEGNSRPTSRASTMHAGDRGSCEDFQMALAIDNIILPQGRMGGVSWVIHMVMNTIKDLSTA